MSLPTACSSFGSSESLVFLYLFQDHFVHFFKESKWNFDRDCIKSVDCFGQLVWTIVKMLILPIHEHELSFNLFVTSSISFIKSKSYSFQCIKSFTSLVKFIPRCFNLLDTTVNGAVFLILVFDSSLLVQRKTTDFVYCSCNLQLCSEFISRLSYGFSGIFCI